LKWTPTLKGYHPILGMEGPEKGDDLEKQRTVHPEKKKKRASRLRYKVQDPNEQEDNPSNGFPTGKRIFREGKFSYVPHRTMATDQGKREKHQARIKEVSIQPPRKGTDTGSHLVHAVKKNP